MADQNVTVKLSATGADETAAEIAKVDKATDELSQQNEKLAAKSNIAGAALIGAAIGGAVVRKTFGEISEAIKSIDIDHLRELDSAMADQMASAQGWSEALSDPISAIQRMISGTTIKEAFAEMNEQLARNVQFQEEAVDRMIANGMRTAEELKAVANEIKAANAILDATDEADAAARDAADEAAIRGGAAPEDVKAKRARDDAAKRINQINRKLDPQIAATNAAYEESAQARINLDLTRRDDRATPADIAKAEKQAADKGKEFQRLREELATAKAIAAQDRRRVGIEAESSVEGLGFDRAQRLKKEAHAADKKAKADDRRAEAEELRNKRSSLADRLEDAEEGLDGSARKRGLQAVKRGMTTGNSALQGFGNRLADGTDSAELQKIGDQVAQQQAALGAQNVAIMKAILAELAKSAAETETLKEQIKNLGRKPGR